MTIKLFEVGGSIRDELMGIDNPPDRDFCAEALSWEALESWCFEKMKKVFLVTPEFFTIRGMMPNGTSIDVVMCRKDGPISDGRHPEHVEPGTLLDDLARRDFTVNAMAREVDPETLEAIGDIIDPFDGRKDLLAHTLKCVGDTSERLDEDGLRVLRAARFCVTKHFGLSHDLAEKLRDPETWQFMISSVSTDRVRQELHKMFNANTAGAIRFFTSDCCSLMAVDVLFGNDFDSNIWLKPTLERR